MKLEVAIEIGIKLEQTLAPTMSAGGTDAIKLLIEAGKRVLAYKKAHIGLHYEPMPSETE